MVAASPWLMSFNSSPMMSAQSIGPLTGCGGTVGGVFCIEKGGTPAAGCNSIGIAVTEARTKFAFEGTGGVANLRGLNPCGVVVIDE
ncbi:hypothetical protein CEXT_663571 [Caerostris extrusa]|uniref:Uncharacterized protein n=1 Tax=Caerostris extrusa TaxID=172846 RepID=A0AAV4PZY5_CAEEX|nr:hypothetical protein CEXT_663571 [Caerostris extrusa]